MSKKPQPEVRSNAISLHRASDPGPSHRLFTGRGFERSLAQPSREHPIIISASELRDFLRCRVLHNWRHQMRLERTRGAENLQFGSLAHEMREAWYRLEPKARTLKAMSRLARERVSQATQLDAFNQLTDEHYELALAMAKGFAAWTLDANNDVGDRAIGLRDCTPERWFDLPLTASGKVRIRGKIDLFFASETQRKVVGGCETKTRSSFRDENTEQLLQLSVYLWALRQLEPKQRRYVMYFERWRKQLPTSRTTAPLFDRIEIERSDEEIAQWATDAELVALDMHGAAIYPNPMDSCQWACDFQGPCLLRGNDADVRHVLTTDFKQKERR